MGSMRLVPQVWSFDRGSFLPSPFQKRNTVIEPWGGRPAVHPKLPAHQQDLTVLPRWTRYLPDYDPEGRPLHGLFERLRWIGWIEEVAVERAMRVRKNRGDTWVQVVVKTIGGKVIGWIKILSLERMEDLVVENGLAYYRFIGDVMKPAGLVFRRPENSCHNT